MTRAATYPNVSCDRHGTTPAPGYAVCPRVANGDPPATFVAATAAELGSILCWSCHELDDENDFPDPLLFCPGCILERGWIPSDEMRPQ